MRSRAEGREKKERWTMMQRVDRMSIMLRQEAAQGGSPIDDEGKYLATVQAHPVSQARRMSKKSNTLNKPIANHPSKIADAYRFEHEQLRIGLDPVAYELRPQRKVVTVTDPEDVRVRPSMGHRRVRVARPIRAFEVGPVDAHPPERGPLC